MKKLIVFYSRTGNTKKIAKEIAAKLKAYVDEVVCTNNYQGIFGYLKASFSVLFKKTPKI